MAHPLDVLLCDLRELVKALNKLVGTDEGLERDIAPSAPSQRLFATARKGRLAGANPHRTAFAVHNATDGTLLVRLGGEEDVTSKSYTWAIGPGENFTTKGRLASELAKAPLRFAWVNDTDHAAALTNYPSGVFLSATGGALMFTEIRRELR